MYDLLPQQADLTLVSTGQFIPEVHVDKVSLAGGAPVMGVYHVILIDINPFLLPAKIIFLVLMMTVTATVLSEEMEL